MPLPGSRRSAPHAVSASLGGTAKTNETGSAAQGIGVRAADPVLSFRSPPPVPDTANFGCVAAPAAGLPGGGPPVGLEGEVGSPGRSAGAGTGERLGLSPATTRKLDSGQSRRLGARGFTNAPPLCRAGRSNPGGGRNRVWLYVRAPKRSPTSLASSDLPLTRAIIQYPRVRARSSAGGRMMTWARPTCSTASTPPRQRCSSSAAPRCGTWTSAPSSSSWTGSTSRPSIQRRLLLRSPATCRYASGEVVSGPLRQYCRPSPSACSAARLHRAGPGTTCLRIGFREIIRDCWCSTSAPPRASRSAPGTSPPSISPLRRRRPLHRARAHGSPEAEFERLLLEAFPAAGQPPACRTTTASATTSLPTAAVARPGHAA